MSTQHAAAAAHEPRGWKSKLVVECSLKPCRRFHLSHRFARQAPGIFLEGRWYCSSACFRDAAEVQLARLLAEQQMELPSLGRRLPFRLVLLDRDEITAEQLEQAHREAEEARSNRACELGDLLVRLGFATVEQVALARASEFGCGFYAGETGIIDQRLALPVELSRQYSAILLRESSDAEGLLLGFVYRVDGTLLRAARAITNTAVTACILTPQIFERQLALQPGSDIGKSSASEIVSTPSAFSPAIDTLVAMALEYRAEQVRLACTRAHIWIRYQGRSAGANLLLDTAYLGEKTVRSEAVGLANAEGQVPNSRKRPA